MTGSFAAGAASEPMAAKGAGPLQASLVPIGSRPIEQAAGVLGEQKPEGPGALKAAGAANASRGGALDFLGMPVRLAPSLSGNAETQQAAEVRKVLPAGAAAVIRPNEFGAMKNKLFPSISTVEAEPNKAAWQKAAPSFGLRDAEPHTILSPDSRIKPPHESAPLPQMGDGAASPLTRALHAATVVAPAAAAATGAEPGHLPGGPLIARSLPHIPSFAGAAQARPMSLGPLPNLGLAHPGSHHGAGIGDVHFGTMPHLHAGQATPRSRGFSLPALPALSGQPFAPAAAGAAASGSTRVASRFSPYQPAIGGGPTAAVHEAQPSTSSPSFFGPAQSTTPATAAPIGMSQPGDLRSPAIPAVTPAGTPATPSMNSSGYAGPSMARPATPTTTASARTSLPTVSMPSMSQASYGGAASSSMPTSTSTSLVSRAPQMPVAASVPASRSFQKSQTIIQKAISGGAVHANATEHGSSTESSTNSTAQDPGASAHEIGLLANEVWSLLKRKLQFEADRLGKRF
jgi:hypothetical protein